MEERPGSLTDEMALRAATKTAQMLAENGLIDPKGFEESAKDIAEEGTLYGDGYDLAKALDDAHIWNCSLTMAEALDAFSGFARKEIEEAARAWFEANKIEPAFSEGDKILTSKGEPGTVRGINEHGPGQYLVEMDGDPRAAPPTCSRRIVNFEDATAHGGLLQRD